MIRKLPLLLLVLAAFLYTHSPQVVAQDAAEDEAADVSVAERVNRARRLREFGYPLLAREQLDIAARRSPADRAVLLEYVRLFTRDNAEASEIQPFLATLLELYPEDYDACFEIALWLFTNERSPSVPSTESDERIAMALERLGHEMQVYRALGRYLVKPEGDLPREAQGRPAMPLAYLARCAKVRPGSADVAEFAAQYLDVTARRFHEWSMLDSRLRPFGEAALELYDFALPLYRRAQEDERYTAGVRTRVTNLLFRMGRYEDARREAAVASILAPDSLLVTQTLLHIAEATSNLNLLIDALERQNRIFADESSRVELSAAKRIRDREWAFQRWIEFRDLLVLPHRDQGRFLIQMLEHFPDFAELHYLLARHRMETAFGAQTPEQKNSMLEGVLAALEKAKDISAKADWHGLYAACMWELARFEEAAVAYRRVAELDANDQEAPLRAKAAQDIAEGKYTPRDYFEYRRSLEPGMLTETRTRLLEVTRRSPQFFEAHLVLGKVGALLTDLDTSYTAYARALALVPDNQEALDGAAEAAMHLGRFERAAEIYRTIHELKPEDSSADYWAGLNEWAAGASEAEGRAVRRWLESSSHNLTPTERREKLVEALRLAPKFPEAAIELAAIERQRREFGTAERLLQTALENARDKYVRATMHREAGRLFMAMGRTDRAIDQFHSAYDASPDDGSDLLLAALALSQRGEHALAAVAMRRLFADHPRTHLLRPRPHEVNELDLLPASTSGQRRVSPVYEVDDVLNFRAEINVEGEGRGQLSQPLSLEYGLRVTVQETPAHGGLWRLRIQVSSVPTAEWAALEAVDTTIRVSPWFGLVGEPAFGGYEDVLGPAVQALVEALTAGLGDSPVPPPHVWQNKLTVGPPRFGGDSVEGSMIAELLGDNKVIVRRAAAGRRLGTRSGGEATFARSLETRIEIGGQRRTIRKAGFEIYKEELTPERDDVVRSRLSVTLTAR